MHPISTLRAVLLVLATLAFCHTVPACHLVRTATDVAEVVCNHFAAAHPAEFEDLVREQLAGDPEMLGAAQRDGFDPRVLCILPNILKPFLAQQQALAAAHAEESAAPPPVGPGEPPTVGSEQ